MNINFTLLSSILEILLLLIGVILGPIIVNKIARVKVDHVTRSTIFAFFLSIMPPLVFVQIILLLNKPDLPSKKQSL